ncbi:MAG: DnaJ domain-containing protein [Clostridiales bacterium]|nr:DnaJ domain-containing protein [Candidatus Apopatousia equi]
MENYYKILGVKQTSSQEQIKKAYLSCIKKYHPDIYKGDKVFAEKQTEVITEAYTVLKNMDERKKYDRKLNDFELKQKQDIKVKKQEAKVQKQEAKAQKKQSSKVKSSKEQFFDEFYNVYNEAMNEENNSKQKKKNVKKEKPQKVKKSKNKKQDDYVFENMKNDVNSTYVSGDEKEEKTDLEKDIEELCEYEDKQIKKQRGITDLFIFLLAAILIVMLIFIFK